ncbi:ABC transporter ATP-binding protein [Pelagibius sp.]|uniref:ABC transporter ATP-binding protein n=1 Tax=Pelagibius sp. TaxID=1931238 RepID=UPI003BB02853
MTLSVDALSRPGLEPLSFSLAAGESVALSGPSGAGKSLLLRALADLDPCVGDVTLDGKDRRAMSGPGWRRLVGYLPAEPGWWSDRLEDHFQNWDALAPLAGRLHLKAGVDDRPVPQLSTGERQRLALLRAIERKPKVLLLDEPTGPLDEEATAAVETLLKEQQNHGLALLWVTHDRRQAERVATRRFWIDRGRLREALQEDAQ